MSPDRRLGPALYKQLIRLYPPAFREQLGESMVQTFNDLYRERQHQPAPRRLGLMLNLFADTGVSILAEQWRAITVGGRLPGGLEQARPAALAGLLLALPFSLLLGLILLKIDPPLGPLRPLLVGPADGPHVLGTAVVVGAWLLSVAGLLINLRVLARGARAGSRLAARPLNLALAVAVLFCVALFVGAVVADQYPCWAGVPNCD